MNHYRVSVTTRNGDGLYRSAATRHYNVIAKNTLAAMDIGLGIHLGLTPEADAEPCVVVGKIVSKCSQQQQNPAQPEVAGAAKITSVSGVALLHVKPPVPGRMPGNPI